MILLPAHFDWCLYSHFAFPDKHDLGKQASSHCTVKFEVERNTGGGGGEGEREVGGCGGI